MEGKLKWAFEKTMKDNKEGLDLLAGKEDFILRDNGNSTANNFPVKQGDITSDGVRKLLYDCENKNSHLMSIIELMELCGKLQEYLNLIRYDDEKFVYYINDHSELKK